MSCLAEHIQALSRHVDLAGYVDCDIALLPTGCASFHCLTGNRIKEPDRVILHPIIAIAFLLMTQLHLFILAAVYFNAFLHF